MRKQLFIFEEHHEAFFVWNYAANNQLIQHHNNVLLHVDQHSDMGVPRFNKSLKFLQNNLHDIYDFTYNELHIGNFIIPAIYQGLFNKIYWLYQTNNEGKKKSSSMLVYSTNGEGNALAIIKDCDLGALTLYNPDYKTALFQLIKPDDELPQSKSVVLDIDLDYFSCNPDGFRHQGKVEITREQFVSFNQDKHHFLRLCYGSGVKTKFEDEKYYLLFNSSQASSITEKTKHLKVSKEEIIKRIDLLIEFLKKNNIQPDLIDICRSRISGFTPHDQWEFIEEILIEKLSGIYEMEVNSISKILPGENSESLALNLLKD